MQIVKFISEVLVLDLPNENSGIVLVLPDGCVGDGAQLF